MDAVFVAEQLLNGVGYGLMLFLIAAGLTLVFGIMDTMNLAHGSLFMVGAYLAARIHVSSGSMWVAVGAAVVVTMGVAWVLEKGVMRFLYRRDHLAQVLATFGIILIADDAVKAIWGVAPMMAPMPSGLSQPIMLLPGLYYPAYRLLRSEEHTSELQSRGHLVCRLLLEKKKEKTKEVHYGVERY